MRNYRSPSARAMTHPRRRGRLLAMTAIVAAATLLVGYLVVGNRVDSFAATGSNAEWRITNVPSTDRTGFARMIGGVRAALSQGRIPAGNNNVDVTDRGPERFVNIDIHDDPDTADRFVRLVMRASDGFIIGWWAGGTGDGGLTRFFALERGLAGRVPGATAGNTDTRFENAANYTDLQRFAGRSREGLTIGVTTLANAVAVLQRADQPNANNQVLAVEILRMIVGVAETARFREQAVDIANAMGNGQAHAITTRQHDLHNNWLRISEALLQITFGIAVVGAIVIAGAPVELTAAALGGLLLIAHHSNIHPPRNP